MNEEASEAFGAPSLAFYKAKGIVKLAKGASGVAEVIGCNEADVADAFKTYGDAATKGEDEHGKTVFPAKDWRLDQDFRESLIDSWNSNIMQPG